MIDALSLGILDVLAEHPEGRGGWSRVSEGAWSEMRLEK